MSDRTSRVQEVTDLYLQILQHLNRQNFPEWLELDLTFQQMKVLYILKQSGPLKMSLLSKRLEVSMPTITGIISRLVERKEGEALVQRVNSPNDRREVWAHLTEAGRQATEKLDQLNHKLLANALAQLNDGEIEDARAGLNHILTAVKDQTPVAVGNGVEPATVITRVIGEEPEVITRVEPQPALN